MVAGVAYLGGLTQLRGFAAGTRSPSGGISPEVWLWTVTLLGRAVLLWAAPGDDVWRYLWEGRLQGVHLNPYALAPATPGLSLPQDAAWALVNHREWKAIYPPGAEALFRVLAPGGVPAFKAAALAADLGVIFVLRWAWPEPLGATTVAAYAWNPLVVYAGAAHFDSWMVLAVAGALACWGRITPGPPERAGGRMAAGTSSLAVGIALKLVPAVLLPLWAWHLRRRAVWLLLAPGLLLALAMAYGYPGLNPLAELARFARVSRANDLLWWALDPLLPNPWGDNRLYERITLLAVLALAWCGRRRPLETSGDTLACVAVLSPALHPWYLLWALPFVLQRPYARAYLVLTVSVFAYFTLTSDSPLGRAWQQPWWHHLVVVAPPLAILVWRATARFWQPAKG